jgi:hypothetical protein
MRVTVEISDPLLREAQEVAEREGVSLQELVEVSLSEAIGMRMSARFRLRDGSFKGGKGLHPDVQHLDWQQIRDLSYGDRGGTFVVPGVKPSPRKARGR